MATSHFQHFIGQATVFDPPNDGTLPPGQAFRAGMHRCGIDAGDSSLRMTGPAADYILYSYPAAA